MAGCQQGGQSVACRLGIASCAALKCNLELDLCLKIVSRDSLFLIQPSLFKPAIQTAVMEGMTAMEPQAHSNRQSFETIRYTTNAMESAIGVRSMFKDSNMSKQVTVVRSSAFCSQAHLGKVKMIQNSSNPQALPDRSGHCRFPLFPPVSTFQSKFCQGSKANATGAIWLPWLVVHWLSFRSYLCHPVSMQLSGIEFNKRNTK